MKNAGDRMFKSQSHLAHSGSIKHYRVCRPITIVFISPINGVFVGRNLFKILFFSSFLSHTHSMCARLNLRPEIQNAFSGVCHLPQAMAYRSCIPSVVPPKISSADRFRPKLITRLLQTPSDSFKFRFTHVWTNSGKDHHRSPNFSEFLQVSPNFAPR